MKVALRWANHLPLTKTSLFQLLSTISMPVIYHNGEYKYSLYMTLLAELSLMNVNIISTLILIISLHVYMSDPIILLLRGLGGGVGGSGR